MLVTPLRQRRDDAVAGAGDPAGIGGAPEDVVVVQVERVEAGDMMRHDRLVHVDGALGPARRAAGEVQQRHVLGQSRRNGEMLAWRWPSTRVQGMVPAYAGRRHRSGSHA